MAERVVSDFGVDLCAEVVTGTLRFLLRPIVITFKWSYCLCVVFLRVAPVYHRAEGRGGTTSLCFANTFRFPTLSFIHAGHG